MTTAIEEMKKELREDYRIKDGCDYAIVHKYGETHVLCASVYYDSVAEVAEKHGVKLTSCHSYPPTEGFYESAKDIVRDYDNGVLKGVYPTVAEAIDIILTRTRLP